ncbi:MAG: diguanylate cyclase [Sphingomonadaceae bacterium]|nr:diguanylate cyclase [Sphingomonadaceae bacterium]
MRLVLFAVALAAFGLTLSGIFLLRGYEKVNINLAGQTIAYNAEPSLFDGDRGRASALVEAMQSVGSVQHASILDASGDELASWSRPYGVANGFFREFFNRVFWPESYRIPVRHGGERIGTVVMRGNAQGLVRYSISGLVIALCCLGITLIATRMLARELEEQIIMPLEHVAEVAAAVRNERAFSRRVSLSGIQEVDNFGQDFNALLEELEGWHNSMQVENKALAHQAEHDGLTGLGNRVRFERMLAGTTADAARRDSRFSILFIDLDHFKAINDDYGHPAGDHVLTEFGARLRASVRGQDQVFRLGGDEFAILLDPAQERLHPHQVAARIEAAMLPPVTLRNGERVVISPSIGTATYPQDGLDPEELMRKADAKMYQRKREQAGKQG